ncbi:hypothetical protein [Couchioplanes azureus]|uniref:hypothetical protein n=1 Tax=Couchioplanes caeruleus TaxID=56438 RepID=UPI001670AA5D|nr:hypothetical protein [Couchioplanes caeruleus]GGQ69343.1 hypothetical protein GCM10010166_43930 [Couchioplanes caeruleus subsp. azureus]
MRTKDLDATIFTSASLLALAFGGKPDDAVTLSQPRPDGRPGDYAGYWRNADDTVRLWLAEDWSYEGKIAGRRRSAKGTYRPDGDGLLLSDETGLRTRVERAEYGLEMAGHLLHKVADRWA